MALRHRHWDAAQKPGRAQAAEHEAGFKSEHGCTRPRPVMVAIGADRLRRGTKDQRRRRQDQQHLQCGKAQHRGAPADMGLRDRENRRPDRGGYGRAAAEQRQCRAAPAIKPTRHVNIERRVDAGIAQQADEDAVADEQTERTTALRNQQPECNHRRAEHHGETDAEALGGATHRNAAEGRAEPSQRIGKRRHRTLAAEIGGDRFQAHHRDSGRGKRHRRDTERRQAYNPRRARLERRRRQCRDDS